MAEDVIDRIETARSHANRPVEAEEEERSIDLIVVAQTLVRGRRTIFGIAFSILLVVTAVAYLLPPMFTSTVSFVPPNFNSGSSLASAVVGQLSSLGAGALLGGGAKGSGDLYAGILKSRSVLGELVKRFDLMQVYKVKRESEAETVLDSNTKVTVDAKSSIVTVDVKDKSPKRAQELANGYMDALRETNGRLALTQSSQRALFFGQQLVQEKNALEDAEVALQQTEENSGLIAPAGQTEAEIMTIANTQAQIAVRQVQLAALRQSATDENPEVIQLNSEIADLQGQLARLLTGKGKGTPAAIPTSQVPQLQMEYLRKEREVKYHEALFEMLSKQYEAARLDEANDAPVLQVLDSASYPDLKSSPKRLYFMLGGLVLGLIVGCGWVLLYEPFRAICALIASGESPTTDRGKGEAGLRVR